MGNLRGHLKREAVAMVGKNNILHGAQRTIHYVFVMLGLVFVAEESSANTAPQELPEIRLTSYTPLGPTPNFAAMADVKAKKAAFFSYLLPAVRAHNTHIRQLRALVVSLRQVAALTPEQTLWLELLAQIYLIEETLIDGEAFWQQLLLRVDTVPASLALAQAANESAYGTSRFATRGNNYFGQWCLQKGCGLVPSQRTRGADHEVAVFTTYAESVGSYIHNINTNPAYSGFRRQRNAMRQNQQALNSVELVSGLQRYSARGEDYTQAIGNLIVKNNLQAYDYAHPLAH